MPALALVALGLGLFVLASPRRPSAWAQRRDAVRVFRAAVARAASSLGVVTPRVIELRGVRARARAGRIEVDPQWVLGVIERNCAAGTQCAIQVLVGIGAHETSHVAHGDRGLPPGPASRSQEIIADFVAGHTCIQLGLSTEDLERVIGELSRICGTHPTWPTRAAAIRLGASWGAYDVRIALRANAGWIEAESHRCRIVRLGFVS